MTRMARAARCLAVVALAGAGLAAAGRDVRPADAAQNGDWETVRALVKQRVDVNARQADGATALHWAAYWDELDSADQLIRAGAAVNAANDLGVTPLWAACENGSAAMVRRLLQAGANPNLGLLSGETPVMAAARAGNADAVAQLVAKGADVNVTERKRHQTALMWAVAQQHSAVVKVLLAHGANFRVRSKTYTQVVKTTLEAFNPAYVVDIQQGGYTPLLFAARVGDLASAKLLVELGADVNDTAPYGTSATVVAAHSGHGDVAAFLLDKGADANAAGAGYTALHAAILHKDEKLVEALLAHGANPNAPLLSATPTRRDSIDFFFRPAYVGATPFWLAARYSAPQIMRLLAKHGADPRFVHDVGYWAGAPAPVPDVQRIEEGETTALMAAVGMGGRSPVIAVERLARIAEAAPVRASRRDPDPVALEATTLDAVRTAAGLGVDVNAANAEGNTALHVVAARGYDSVVKFLIDQGARLDAANKKGQTPLAFALAARPPVPHTVELLRKVGAKE